MRFSSRRSDIKSAFFRIERCREIDGPEMVKHAVISPAESSPRLSSCRIWRRVGSAKARNALEMDFITNNIAILLNSVKSKKVTDRRESITAKKEARPGPSQERTPRQSLFLKDKHPGPACRGPCGRTRRRRIRL